MQLDYWFSTVKGESCGEEAACTTQLTVVDVATQYPACMVCEKKGKDAYVVENILRFIEDTGVSDVRLQTDSEGAIKNLIKAVYYERAKKTADKTFMRVAPRYSHQSNGAVERMNRNIQ